LKAAKEETTKWQNKYEGQWLAGKSHRLLAWITGFIVAFFIIDGLLYIFTNFSINPFTVVFQVFGKVFGKLLGKVRG
jgi:hypothetical protein